MTESLADYGLVLLFAIAAFQAAGVGGLPGKTALVAAAILAARGHFSIWAVVAVAAVGVTLGGYVGYAVCRRAGRRICDRPMVQRHLGRWLAVAETFFDRHGTKAVFLARFLPGLKVVAAPAAGICCMPWRDFAVWHAAGAVAFALLFGLGGYFVGESAIELVEHYGLIALAPLGAALVLAWLAWQMVRRRRAATAPS